MTILDKLANEHSKEFEKVYVAHSKASQAFYAYRAGFIKCREMANARFVLGFERHDVVQDILDDIARLGEEEWTPTV